MPVGIRLKTSVKSKPRVPLARRSKEASGIKSIRRRKDDGETKEGQLHGDGNGNTTDREKRRYNPKGRYTSETKVRKFNEDDPRLDRNSNSTGREKRIYNPKGRYTSEAKVRKFNEDDPRLDRNGNTTGREKRIYNPKGRYTSEAKVRKFNEDDPRLDRNGNTTGREERIYNPKGRYTSEAKVRKFNEDDPRLDRNSNTTGREERIYNPKGRYTSEAKVRKFNEDDPRLDRNSNTTGREERIYNPKGRYTSEAKVRKFNEDDPRLDRNGNTKGREKRIYNPKGRYTSEAKVRKFNEDDPLLDRESEERSPRLRLKSGKKDEIYKRNGSYKTDRGTNSEKSRGKVGLKERNDIETSTTRFSLKRKKGKEDISADDRKGDSKHGAEEKQVNEEKVDQNSEQKYRRLPSRVLDKSGKKIRVNRKALEDGSAGLQKKKKRTIKIDPYDFSNKRLDDSVILSDNVEEEKDEISKNAQFRAIQPSPEILSFVEDNLIGRRRLIELQNAGYNVKLSAPLDNNPFSTSSEREKIEESVFRNKMEFFAAAKISSSFPPPLIPEIAFAGRSNVGKSSLLNALTRQWGVARTSDKPGLTQTINFFRLASKLCLVDLPGYGFAYAKEEVKESWEELVKEYVSTRVGLQRVCLLVDTKWGMKPRDHELIDLMERSQTPYQIVLTKTDIVFPIDVARRAMEIQENLKSNHSLVKPVMMMSSKSGAGIHSLRTVLAKLARFIKP